MPTRFASRSTGSFEPTIAGTRSRPPRWVWWIATVAAVAGLVVGSYAWGHHEGSRVTWHSATAYTTAGRAATMQAGGWTYAVEQSVTWIDTAGSTHDSGWPTCLRAPAASTVPVRFASVDVDVDGHRWREVVMVDCQHS